MKSRYSITSDYSPIVNSLRTAAKGAPAWGADIPRYQSWYLGCLKDRSPVADGARARFPGGLANIGETGFEPATARPPAECATRLRHSPWGFAFCPIGSPGVSRRGGRRDPISQTK